MQPSSESHSLVLGLVGLAAGAATAWALMRSPRAQAVTPASPGNLSSSADEQKLKPPFPPEMVKLLDAASLCYLSTAQDSAPHLSLMSYTYVPESGTILFSTRRNTKKCANLKANPRVAILLHDFPHLKVEGALLTIAQPTVIHTPSPCNW